MDRVHDCPRERTCVANISEGCVVGQAATPMASHEDIRAYLSAAGQPTVPCLGCAVGNVNYRQPIILRICFRQVKSDAFSNQSITFTRRLREALPIKYRDLTSATL